jgi:hypothetical protein
MQRKNIIVQGKQVDIQKSFRLVRNIRNENIIYWERH